MDIEKKMKPEIGKKGLRMSIKLKLTSLTVALIVITMAITGVIIYNEVKNRYMEEIERRGKTLARIIALNAEEPLFREDDIYLTQLVKNALINRAGVFCFILDAKENYITPFGYVYKDSIKFDVDTYRNEYQPFEGGDILGEKDILTGMVKFKGQQVFEIAMPVKLAGKKKIGEIHLGLDLKKMKETLRRLELFIVIFTIGGMIFGIVGSFLVASFLIKPIKLLVDGVNEIGKGNFDIRIRVTSRDEIGDLTKAVNEMAKSLKEKEQIKDAFRRYVSHQVAEEILKDPDAYFHSLKGEKRKVAILFGDIRGFTPLSEKLPPEEVVAILNKYLSEMTTMVFKHEGTVDKFIGDCIMAIFGAPLWHGDDVRKAVTAALDIQLSLYEENIERIENNLEPIKVGIGINFGEAVVGNIGSYERLEYTVIGDSVNLASRIQGFAKGGEVVVTDNVYREVQHNFIFQSKEFVKVKGKSKPIQIYLVHGTADGEMRLKYDIYRGKDEFKIPST